MKIVTVFLIGSLLLFPCHRAFAVDVSDILIQSVNFSDDTDTATLSLTPYLSGREITIGYDILQNEKKITGKRVTVTAEDTAKISGFRNAFRHYGKKEDIYRVRFAVCPSDTGSGITVGCGTALETVVEYSPIVFSASCTIVRTKLVGAVYTFQLVNAKTKKLSKNCHMGQYELLASPGSNAQVLEVTDSSIIVRTAPLLPFDLTVKWKGQSITHHEGEGTTGTFAVPTQRQNGTSSPPQSAVSGRLARKIQNARTRLEVLHRLSTGVIRPVRRR